MTHPTVRGHRVFRRGNDWFYSDDESPVPGGWKDRPCGICHAPVTPEGHDPCIANLPGVTNACCGHGVEVEAYAVFEDGTEVRGKDALR